MTLIVDMSSKICTRSDCESDRAETGECHCSVYGGDIPEMSDSTFHPLTLAVDLNEWNALHAERDALRGQLDLLGQANQTLSGQNTGLAEEIERLLVELTHRVGWEERCLRAEAALQKIADHPSPYGEVARRIASDTLSHCYQS